MDEKYINMVDLEAKQWVRTCLHGEHGNEHELWANERISRVEVEWEQLQQQERHEGLRLLLESSAWEHLRLVAARWVVASGFDDVLRDPGTLGDAVPGFPTAGRFNALVFT